MARPPFQFSITDGAGNWYQSVGNVVSEVGAPVYMKDVVDWATLALNYRRDSVMLGIIRSYSPESVRFVKKAAQILRYIKNTQGGSEATAYLAVSLLNKTTQQYQLLDYWQFDFSKTNNQQFYYEIMLMEGGLSALVKAYSGNNYNTPLNDPALAPNFPLYNSLPADQLPLTPPTNNPIPPPVPQMMYLDGIPILGAQQYTGNLGASGGAQTINVGEPLTSAENIWTIGLSAYQTLGDYTGGLGTANIQLVGQIGGFSPFSDSYIFQCVQECTMSISYNLGFIYKNNNVVSGYKLQLAYEIYDGVGGGWGSFVTRRTIQEDTAFLAPGATSAHLNWVGKSDDFVLEAGYVVVVGFSIVLAGAPIGSGVTVTLDAPAVFPALQVPYIQLNLSFLPPSSVCRVVSQYQLFQYLTAQMATNGGLLPNAYRSRSNLLSTTRVPGAAGNWDLDPARTFFTCGDSLRGLKTITVTDPYFNGGLPFDTYVVPAIYTNMQDFAKDLLTDLCASIGIEKNGFGTDTLVAESLYYFFDDNTEIADLGDDISDFAMTDFTDYQGSGIALGQTDQQFDAINGPLEALSEVDYSTPITRTIKQIDLKTNYRADPYGIELTRANVGNKTNVNSSSDNDTFKLHALSLNLSEIDDVSNWGGLSGFNVGTLEALVLRRAYVSSGLPAALLSPTVGNYSMYNLQWSPQRKALRSLPWLCSNYRGLINSLMGITAYKKNIKLISDLGSGPVTESNWLNLASVAQTYTPPFSTNPVTVPPPVIPAGRTNNLIFLPYQFTFTSKVPVNLPLLMTPPGTAGGGKMYGKIKFTFKRGTKVYPLAGFVLEAGITPGTNATYKYRLLCSPTVNIPADL